MKRLLMILATISPNLMAAQLGVPGQDGWSAVPGSSGSDGGATALDVDGANHSLVMPGGDGGDARGAPEDGQDAQHCYQPDPRNDPNLPNDNLYGANGGDGGSGARGGAGGDGGRVGLFVSKEAQFSLLKKIHIDNPGGHAGKSVVASGQGGAGCHCTFPSWEVASCDWTYYRIVPEENGQPSRREQVSNTSTNCTHDQNPPAWHPTSGPGEWVLSSRNQRQYSCYNGRQGSKGSPGGVAAPGNYGAVSIYMGGTSKTTISPHADLKIGEAINHAYLFSTYDSEPRSGLRALLAPHSDVSDYFWLKKFYQRTLQVKWTAKPTPVEAGVADGVLDLDLVGSASKPSFAVAIPAKLTYRMKEEAGLSTLTITHVLNSTDPDRIAACATKNGRGSYVCEFSGQCIYEDGDCLPR